jgi:phthiocerol/phenolphthiocerol synthesis type-I polyketide synthase E
MPNDKLTGEVTSRQYLLQLWRDQLGSPSIQLQDDFFACGGSSMQVIEMLATVSEKFERDIDYEEFFKDPSVRKLSDLLQV